MRDITDTLRALVYAMSDVHTGDRHEAYAIAKAIYAAIRDGQVPQIKLDDHDE